MQRILITGCNGQLGRSIAKRLSEFWYKSEAKDILADTEWFFTSRRIPDYNMELPNSWVKTLDIRDRKDVNMFFYLNRPDIVVNCAAYTDVEQAEIAPQEAEDVNVKGVENLIAACKKYDAYLIHISTDYVFDGRRYSPYHEDSKTHPLSVYGKTKVKGEKRVLKYDKGLIIRTSWLYSEFGKNFLKTMLSRIEKKLLSKVVIDQMGSPTYASDLADFIIFLITTSEYNKCHILHFRNTGSATWCKFATYINFLYNGLSETYIEPCTTGEGGYKTIAERPSYSVLSIEKSVEIMSKYENGLPKSLSDGYPRYWTLAVRDCYERMVQASETLPKSE